MTRAVHIGLLLLAMFGLIGQSTATAPAAIATGSMNVSMPGADCVDPTSEPSSNKLPCKKMTLQCMAAMGCMPLSLVALEGLGGGVVAAARDKTLPSPAVRLRGCSYGPEPDPPSILI